MNWSAGHSYPGGYKTYYEDNGVTFELTKSNYKEILTTAFQDQPEMKEQIDKSKFKHLDKLIEQYITFTKASH
jgi:hypothetical protein